TEIQGGKLGAGLGRWLPLHGPGGQVRGKPVRPARHARQRLAMVRGLVRQGLLQEQPSDRSRGAQRRLLPRAPRRLVRPRTEALSFGEPQRLRAVRSSLLLRLARGACAVVCPESCPLNALFSDL